MLKFVKIFKPLFSTRAERNEANKQQKRKKDHNFKDMLRTTLNPVAIHKKHLEELVEGFAVYFPKYEITTAPRIAAFIAQAAHETGGFKWFFELGTPLYFQKYEPHTSIGRRLGNTQPGDGFRYRGRGIFQLTGRWNYLRYSELIDLDLIHNPDMASEIIIACHIACEYWAQHKLNTMADTKDMRTITRRINGGYNGLVDRLRYYKIFLNSLSTFLN